MKSHSTTPVTTTVTHALVRAGLMDGYTAEAARTAAALLRTMPALAGYARDHEAAVCAMADTAARLDTAVRLAAHGAAGTEAEAEADTAARPAAAPTDDATGGDLVRAVLMADGMDADTADAMTVALMEGETYGAAWDALDIIREVTGGIIRDGMPEARTSPDDFHAGEFLTVIGAALMADGMAGDMPEARTMAAVVYDAATATVCEAVRALMAAVRTAAGA